MYQEVTGHRALGLIATKPTMIITTRHASGIVNAGVFGAYTNLSPTQVGVAIATDSHTYANIRERREFVINIPGADLVGTLKTLADDIPPDTSEVAAAGLSLKESLTGNTPSIAECQAAVELVFEQEVPVGGHSFMIGAVQGGWVRREVLDQDGKINIFKARVMKDFKYPQPWYVLPGEVVKG